MKKLFSVKTIVEIAIGAALFLILGRFVAIPSGIPNTNISIQYGVLAFIAVLFGPVVGALSGLIGHFFVDFSYGWGVWLSWVVGSGVVGLIMGLFGLRLHIREGEFSIIGIIAFNIGQLIANVAAWDVVAPILGIILYAEPASKVFVQGAVSAIANIITTAVIGTILCLVYAKVIPKKSKQ